MENSVIGILGTGTMGKQLALLFAANNLSVKIWNYRHQSDFLREFGRLISVQSKLGHIPRAKIGEITERIDYTNDLATLSRCALIIETVIEDKEAKIATIGQLIEVADEQAIVATNTSTLSITELASYTKYPSHFLGLHFFNPPMSMKLVEVIRGDLTSEETLTRAKGILEAVGKQPVILADTAGFIVNRMLFPLLNEAMLMLSEGISDAKTIDGCMRLGANHPIGPLELADLIGLDNCLRILETLYHKTGDSKFEPTLLLREHVGAGRLGRKVGSGFYAYKKH